MDVARAELSTLRDGGGAFFARYGRNTMTQDEIDNGV
jgi:hypothetical protein